MIRQFPTAWRRLLRRKADRIRIQVYAERVELEQTGVPAEHDLVRRHREFALAVADLIDGLARRRRLGDMIRSRRQTSDGQTGGDR